MQYTHGDFDFLLLSLSFTNFQVFLRLLVSHSRRRWRIVKLSVLKSGRKKSVSFKKGNATNAKSGSQWRGLRIWRVRYTVALSSVVLVLKILHRSKKYSGISTTFFLSPFLLTVGHNRWKHAASCHHGSIIAGESREDVYERDHDIHRKLLGLSDCLET